MNVVDFIIVIIFIGAVFRGYQLGLIRQLIYFLGFFVAFYLAYQFSGTLSPLLEGVIPSPDFEKSSLYMFAQSFDLKSMYYNAIAFFLIFIGSKIVLTIGGHILHQIASLPGLATINRLFGAIVGLIQAGLIVIIVIHGITIMPWEELHRYIYTSTTATFLMHLTPSFTDMLYHLWNTSTTNFM